jgi:uncharacterized protein YhdP
MRGASTTERNREAVELARTGLTGWQIAAIQERGVSGVRSAICRAVKRGELPKTVERRGNLDTARVRTALAGVAPGSLLRDVLGPLPPETLAWLLKQVPKGGTAADVVRGLIIDTYWEENPDE